MNQIISSTYFYAFGIVFSQELLCNYRLHASTEPSIV